MNPMILMVAIPGDMIGIAILWNVYNSLAPSILAASKIEASIEKICVKSNKHDEPPNNINENVLEKYYSGTFFMLFMEERKHIKFQK